MVPRGPRAEELRTLLAQKSADILSDAVELLADYQGEDEKMFRRNGPEDKCSRITTGRL